LAISDVAARHWDRAQEQDRRNWWSSNTCQAYYNLAVCGQPLTANAEGCRQYLRQRTGGARLSKGVSIGCGAGLKEMAMIQEDLVEHFDLWEISTRRVSDGEKSARDFGISDRVTYRSGDAFTAAPESEYDLVYWDHSLHHMSDVVAAIRWSSRAVRPGGYVLINDYIGPNRLQWRPTEVERANAFLSRSGLVARVRHSTPLTYLRQWRRDPSEAPQSSQILNSIMLNLTGVEVRIIGGALLNILGPIVVRAVAEDSPVLEAMLAEDADMRRQGTSHFAFACWQKPLS
jgi:SAM-dependent methyltransferase